MGFRLHVSVVLVGGLALGSLGWGHTASVLLEEGLYIEETKGDLNAGVEICKKVVTEPNATCLQVTQALFRMVTCHLTKKPRSKACAAPNKLPQGHPEQTELLAKAKPMLDRIEHPGPVTLMHPDTTIHVEVGSPTQVPNDASGGCPAEVSPVPEKICGNSETFPPRERLRREAGVCLCCLALTNGCTAVALRGCLRIVREPPRWRSPPEKGPCVQ